MPSYLFTSTASTGMPNSANSNDPTHDEQVQSPRMVARNCRSCCFKTRARWIAQRFWRWSTSGGRRAELADRGVRRDCIDKRYGLLPRKAANAERFVSLDAEHKLDGYFENQTALEERDVGRVKSMTRGRMAFLGAGSPRHSRARSDLPTRGVRRAKGR
jgi:hypothetical protein